MAKDKITDYSATAASNTDVGGIGIQGTNAISNIDNAAREIMSHLAETNAGTYPVDDTWSFCDPADKTKIFRFDGVGITTGTTRVLTVPDSNGTLITTGSHPTLSVLEGLTLGAGDMLYATAADTLTDLAIGTAGQFLVTNAGATAPEWASRPTLVSLEGLSLVAGDILYATAADTLARLAKGTAGQALVMNSGATAPEWGAGIVSGTAQASTSGTSIDFTSIPSWVRRITVMLSAVSTNGTSIPILQIGDSGGVEVTGYSGTTINLSTVDSDETNHSSGFAIEGTEGSAATLVRHVTVTLNHINSATNTWAATVAGGRSDANEIIIGGGSKSLTATLDRVRITTANGTDTFDAGVINILYE
jgi:hypothetical protein